MINVVNKYAPGGLRSIMAPITLRFVSTDGLIETMQFLEMCDRSKLDKRLTERADKSQLQIAKELLRRKVRFWEEIFRFWEEI
jgi:hypothetical protein